MWAKEVASRLSAATGDEWLAGPDGAVRCWGGRAAVECREASASVAGISVVGDDPADTARRLLVAATLDKRPAGLLRIIARLALAGGAR